MIEYIPETGSTNADIVARIVGAERVGENNWLVANRQTAGRGRLGREWRDGDGNFMGSTSVRITASDPAPATLALVAGLAVQAAVSNHIPPPGRALLKWPNDVLVAEGKLAGVLLERVGDHVVVGIGVNLAAAPQLPDRATIALTAYGPAPDRDSFAHSLAGHFAREVTRWRSHGLHALLTRWQCLAHPVGTPLAVNQADGSALYGTFAGLAQDGALRLALPGGTTRTIHAGEVMLA